MSRSPHAFRQAVFLFRIAKRRISRFEHIVVLAVYTLIALVMSAPLAAQFGDHIAGVDGDVWSYLWAMGWARVALLNLATNPFHTDYVFYPLGGATQLLWGTALPSFASIPLQLAFGLVPAFNLMYLAASVLTAYGMYLLGKEIFGRGWSVERGETNSLHAPRSTLHLSAFIIGLVFAFGALRLGYGLAFTNLFHTEFIPFYVLFLLRATRHAGVKNAILAGFFFALNVYVDFQIAAFLAVLTGLWFIYFFVKTMWMSFRARREISVRAVPFARWFLTLAVAGSLSLPMLAFLLQDFAIEGENYIRVYPLRYSAERSYDVLSFVIPNARSTIYEHSAPRVEGVNASVNMEGDSELSPDRQSFLGLTALVLAISGAIRFRRAMLFWVIVTLLFAILSLGPVLHIAGNNTNLPLPFVLANNIPILNHIRIPMRYGVMVFFGAALLAGAGAQILFAWRQWLIFPFAVLILTEAAIFPYPTLEFRAPSVYEQIARDPDDVTVLEIPSFNWRYAAKNETYQVIHQKRILRAYTNRIAPDVADYFSFRQTPIVVRSLRILEGVEQASLGEGELRQDRKARNATLNFFNLRYVVLHRDQLDAKRVSEIDAYLTDVLNADAFYQDDQVTAYQFASSPGAQALNLDFADDANLMYLGRGWQIEPRADVDGERGRYLKGATAEIYFGNQSLVNHNLTSRILNSNDPTNITATLNGTPLDYRTIQEGWNSYSLTIPSPLNLKRMNLFQIHGNGAVDTLAVSQIEVK